MIFATALLFAVDTPSFAGVSLGDTRAAVIAERGDPAGSKDDGNGKSHFEYLAPTGGAVELVLFEGDNVSAIAVVLSGFRPSAPPSAPHASGIYLGEPAAQLGANATSAKFTQPAGNGAVYEFGIDQTRGIVGSIALERGSASPAPSSIASLAPIPVHGGTSLDDAIVVRADSDSIGDASEYFYLALHPCGGTGQWKMDTQALLNHNGKSYDRLDVECTTDGEKRSFYFDITSTFGK
jgi:hypothetical protein